MAKILLVDDDPDFVDATKLILEKSGHNVIVANQAKEGWEKAKKEAPDLFIIDVMMESTDAGFQLVYKIKNDDKLKSKPILVLTSVGKVTGFKFDKAKDQEYMPVEEYLEKPVKPEVLLDKINKALGK